MKLLVKMKNVSFILQKKLNRLFGQPNNTVPVTCIFPNLPLTLRALFAWTPFPGDLQDRGDYAEEDAGEAET